MKILMVCDLFQDDLEYQENLLVKYYRKHGHDVTVVASLFESVFDYYADRAPKGGPRSYELNGARIIKLPYRINILNRIKVFSSIAKILSDEAPGLIYLHGISLNLPECIDYVQRHPACRMILDYHGDHSNSGKNWLSIHILHRGIRKRYLDRARPYLSKIFPITPASLEFLSRVYDIPDEELELLPLGADLDVSDAVAEARGGREVRHELGIRADDMVIFTGGKLIPVRQAEFLIDAFLAVDSKDAHLLVVGKADADHMAYQEMLVARAKEHPRIHFVGWLGKEAMYNHLDAADLGVFPGGQSILWQQAIGMGLPLVVGDRGGQLRGHQDARYLNCHDNMIFIDPNRSPAEEIEGHLRALLADRRRLKAMSEGARLTAHEMLDWNRLIDKTLRFNA